MTAFDPYYQWLGIRDSQRPPNHYRLLGLDLFEDDPQVIATAADRQMTHLRTFQNGPRSAESQRLLNEVSEARVSLLDRATKAAYDAALKAQIEPLSESGFSMPRIQIQTPSADSLQLNRPGRGDRDRLPLKWVLTATTLVLLLSAGTFYYRYRKDHPVAKAEPTSEDSRSAPSGTAEGAPNANGNAANRAGQAGETSQASEADRAAAMSQERPGAADSEDNANRATRSADGVTGDDGAATDDGRLSPSDATGKSDHPVTGDGRSPETAKPPAKETVEDSSASVAEREHTSERSPSGATDASSSADKLPPLDWNPSDYEMATQPLTIAPRSPLASYMMQMHQRQLDETQKTMTGWLKTKRSPLDVRAEADLQLMFDTLDQFWSAVDSQLASLKVGDELQFRSWKVTVAQRHAQGITLESATGKKHPFELARGAMHRDLAIGLVERHFRESPGTAYRLIGVFLLIDRDGNQTMAQDYFRRADALGFPAGFLEEVIRRNADPFS